MKLIVFGLSLSSSWGNGHATTYRGLLKAFAARGHEVVFFERDLPWYAASRDLAAPDFCDLRFYAGLDELDDVADEIAAADAVMVGSFVPEGVGLVERIRPMADGVLAFYDIDTPVTVARLESGEEDYIAQSLLGAFDVYLSFSAGPILDRLSGQFGIRNVRPLLCNADTDLYRPVPEPMRFDLGYLGTYDESRQPALERLLIEPARRLPDRRFVVAGAQYPAGIDWPANVERIEHLPPSRHAAFYSSLRFALNVTRADMVRAGFSPSVRVFEAAACGVPVVTDPWPGLETFFVPGAEIMVAASTEDAVSLIESQGRVDARAIGAAARRRVLAEHSAARRAEQLETALTAAAPAHRRHGDGGMTAHARRTAAAPCSGPGSAPRESEDV